MAKIDRPRDWFLMTRKIMESGDMFEIVLKGNGWRAEISSEPLVCNRQNGIPLIFDEKKYLEEIFQAIEKMFWEFQKGGSEVQTETMNKI